jgi:hypothetical protein
LYGHFHHVYSTDPQVWKVFPSSEIFNFSLQWFLVFIKMSLVLLLNLF